MWWVDGGGGGARLRNPLDLSSAVVRGRDWNINDG